MKFQVYQDHAGEFRWRLVAKNGKTVADCGEGYKRRSSCRRAVDRFVVTVTSAATYQVEYLWKEPDWHNEY